MKKHGKGSRFWRRLLRAGEVLVLGGLLAGAVTASARTVPLTMVEHLFDLSHNFRQPSDVAVSAKGQIYVVDGVNNSIKVFNDKGGFLFAFGGSGANPGEFRFPLGIGLDGAGRVYVADSGNHRVQMFTPSGEFLGQWKLPAKDGKAADPTDVAVDSAGTRCFVADNDNHRIMEYDVASRRQVATYGRPGEEKLEFRFPFLLSLHRDKYLYVVDVINTRVQILNREGKFVNFIGGWGVEKGEFYRPKGVAVDKKGRAYVSDSFMGVIQIFDELGQFHSVVGDPATGGVKRFKTPTGLFIDNNRLFVVEMFAEKVSVFRIVDQP